MRRAKRIRTLCGELLPCETFADVGCDHGYCTQYMLEKGLCRRAFLTDISAESLKKAETLLASYIREGKASSACGFGLEKVPPATEQVLIAGMGGEEILEILRRGFLPPVLVLQPMKHSFKVRRYLLEQGYGIDRDYTFADGKFYDVIRARRGIEVREYDERCIRFGYDNVKTPSADFFAKVRRERAQCLAWLAAAGGDAPEVEARVAALTEVYDEAQRNLR